MKNILSMNILEQIPARERRDLLIAWLALAAAFTLARFHGLRLDPLLIIVTFLIALGTAGIAFIIHEMAHKFSAMKFGFWAEFQKDSTMLVVAVVTAALVGIVFAAPGATVIYGGSITREQNGKISLAGPLSNLLLLIPFAILYLIGSSTQNWILTSIAVSGILINAMIAAFNLLPLGPLDGAKILAWNPAFFIGMVLVAFGILFGSMNYL